MTHILNLLPTSSLNSFSLYEKSTGLSLEFNHFWVLGSTVYVFVHKKEQKAKSAKWKSQT